MVMIPTEIRRWIALGALVVVLLFAGAILTMCQARKEAATAHAKAREATAQANAGSAAVRATEGRYERDAATDAQTKSNADFIEGAENGRQDAGEAGLRGRVAYCRRMRNNDPICTGL
jgi:type VI protein secretion system component VasK